MNASSFNGQEMEARGSYNKMKTRAFNSKVNEARGFKSKEMNAKAFFNSKQTKARLRK